MHLPYYMDLATFYDSPGEWRTTLIPQNESELRRSEGSGMLIGDPLW